MPKYYPNSRFSDCYSSVGNITFYHRNGECYYKVKPNPTFPGTPSQIDQLCIHRRAIRAWGELAHETQLQWNALAKNVKSKRPPFNADTHISGYNLFVSAYHGLAAIGKESIPSPSPMPTFPLINLQYKTSTLINGTDLQITFESDTPIDTFNNYTLIGKLQTTKPGYRPNSGKYRNFTSTITRKGKSTYIEFIISNQNTSQMLTNGYSVHIKYFLIHNPTGYRTLESYTSITTSSSLKHIVSL